MRFIFCSISNVDGQALLEGLTAAASQPPKLLWATLFATSDTSFDPGYLLLFAMAVGTIIGGALWAGVEHDSKPRGMAVQHQSGTGKLSWEGGAGEPCSRVQLGICLHSD